MIQEWDLGGRVAGGGGRGGGVCQGDGVVLVMLVPTVITLNTKLQRSMEHDAPKLPVGRTLLPAGRPTSCGFLGQLLGGQCLHT